MTISNSVSGLNLIRPETLYAWNRIEKKYDIDSDQTQFTCHRMISVEKVDKYDAEL